MHSFNCRLVFLSYYSSFIPSLAVIFWPLIYSCACRSWDRVFTVLKGDKIHFYKDQKAYRTTPDVTFRFVLLIMFLTNCLVDFLPMLIIDSSLKVTWMNALMIKELPYWILDLPDYARYFPICWFIRVVLFILTGWFSRGESPIEIVGSEAEVAEDYTKKKHVFRLRCVLGGRGGRFNKYWGITGKMAGFKR